MQNWIWLSTPASNRQLTALTISEELKTSRSLERRSSQVIMYVPQENSCHWKEFDTWVNPELKFAQECWIYGTCRELYWIQSLVSFWASTCALRDCKSVLREIDKIEQKSVLFASLLLFVESHSHGPHARLFGVSHRTSLIVVNQKTTFIRRKTNGVFVLRICL